MTDAANHPTGPTTPTPTATQAPAKSGKCPVMHGAPSNTSGAGRQNRHWWPNQLNLQILHQHSRLSNPLEADSCVMRSCSASSRALCT